MVNIREIIESVDLNEGILNESSFSASKLAKVSDLLATVLGHQLKGEFKQLGGSLGKETFKKKGLGEGQGFKYMNNAGYMIRFGWLKKSKKSKYQINVVDFWDPKDGKKRWDTPTITIKLADWMNIVDVVQELKDVIVSGGHVNESGMLTQSADSMAITEAIKDSNKPPKKMVAFGMANGVQYDEMTDTYQGYINKMEDAGVWDKEEYKGFKVTKNETENNSTEDAFKKADKQLKEIQYADPKYVFDDIEKLTKVVALGGANGLFVIGAPGLGKCMSGETNVPVFGL